MKTTMKIVLGFLFAIIAINAQTVTEELLASQADLAIGHTFFEENILLSRRALSGFIEVDVRRLLDSHMDAYVSIKTTALETTAAIDELEVNASNEACINALRSRWELQITRYGKLLSNCIETSNRSE